MALDADGTAPQVRELTLAASDCALGPRLIANVAERYVLALPKRDWGAPRRTPLRASATPAPPPPPTPWDLRAGAEIGATMGTAPAATQLRLAAGGDIGHGPLRLAAGLGLDLLPSQALGDGRLRLWSVYAAVGPSLDLALGAWTVGPELRILAGVSVAEGRELPGARTRALPLLSGLAALQLRSPGGVVVRAGAQTPWLRARVAHEATGAAYAEPWVRVFLTGGFMPQIETW